MKKRYLSVIILLMLMLAGCSEKKETGAEVAESAAINESSDKYIEELNDNSNLGVELNQDSGLTVEEAKQYHVDQPYVITVDGKFTEYYCFRYPNNEAPLSITQISIGDEEYDVFGIHLGDNPEESIAVLSDWGYEEEDYPVDHAYKYIKGDINVILYYEEDIISRIVVSLAVDTEDGVMY